MMHIKKYLTLSTALVLSACSDGGGGGAPTSSTGDSSGAAASGFEYLSKHCEQADASSVLSLTKCLNGHFAGTSQNTNKACTIAFAFKETGGKQSITQTIYIDDFQKTLDSSVKPEQFVNLYSKNEIIGMQLLLSSTYHMPDTSVPRPTTEITSDGQVIPITQEPPLVRYDVNATITTGMVAQQSPSHYDVEIRGKTKKTYRCNLTGFTPAQ